MESKYNASNDIADKLAKLDRGSTVLELITKFEQAEFLKANLKTDSLSNNLGKPLLDDHYADGAAEGVCSAAVMHWLDTGNVPAPTENMATKLSRVQGSFDLDNEREYLKWISNLSGSFKKLKEPVKDSKGLNLDDTQVFINYLLDFSGKINTEFKFFLILSFRNGIKQCAHAVGWNLGTRSFFDPNYGVWKIKTPGAKDSSWNFIPFSNGSDPATDIASSLLGLDEIREKYGKQVSVMAITF
ncbi:hypothetical protein CTAM01_07394 [Colletotrichum tamarilloi]|uniref:Heme haloperoxidase family profile domain-containing protein n=1 Tax=Colletotrichum tamarilloi TaxID=1209934 RepID=A0ABQ9R8L9_9PEZI|nr:uncharacterized protein CTAM01_07394 [Colletotrichum tamarilloi]KAK1498176.1 hypothetical protein CTAM01_07394 [Colletotrichum tamarilloi]